ncbi:calmodulin-binding transcription activator 4-like isoform X2 [Wolffia australiana]
MTESGVEISRLIKEAQIRWLKPVEVEFILENCNSDLITPEPPIKPPSGSLFLFNRRVLRFFRNDGHAWRRKKDGRTVGEAHEKLKLGNVDRLNCYYAHGEQDPNFQRRCYWILDPALEHIVLVHYRDISEGKNFMPGIVSEWLSTSPFSVDSVGNCKIDGSSKISCSPISGDLTSRESSVETAIRDVDGYGYVSEGSCTSSTSHFNRALKKLELQLSLEDGDYEYIQESKAPLIRKDLSHAERHINESEGFVYAGRDDVCSGLLAPISGNDHNEAFRPSESTWVNGNRPSVFWEGMLELPSSSKSQCISQENSFQELPLSAKKHEDQNTFLHDTKGNDVQSYPELSCTLTELEDLMTQSGDCEGSNRGNTIQDPGKYPEWHLSEARRILLGPDSLIETVTSIKQSPGLEDTTASEADRCISQEESTAEWMSNMDFHYYSSLEFPKEREFSFDQQLSLPSVESSSCLTMSEKQVFNIREISPNWSYSSESSKVIIVGDCMYNHHQCDWKVMFGHIEVPAEMIQKGVIRCQAPELPPGKVSLWLTCGNGESCSEAREFEYRANPSDPTPNPRKNVQELDLLIRFGQILLSGCDSDCDLTVENALLGEGPTGNNGSFDVSDWLLRELLKDKLKQWLAANAGNWVREDQNIIHMISGLGFEWALSPLLTGGIGINFRDSNGWTALHWAARFGRERMVAALLAAGASAVAVTDPTTQDPCGKTPASIAAEYGHRGLAGYLSEVGLTSHLSSLTVDSSKFSGGSFDIATNEVVESINQKSVKVHPGATEDQLCLKDSLAAVRNAAQAAARIQSAFRAHSFRKQQLKDHNHGDDPCELTPREILRLSAASKALRPPRDSKLHSAALYIQRKFRGWRGRQSFLTLRQNVVKIQAHVRGHQVRKKYKQFIWTVGVLEKVILRWRRRGSGLRGFKADTETVDEEVNVVADDDDDDILKVFRKQKVDAALDEALKRVLSVVESAEARQQYRRMIESYRVAKADSDGVDSAEVAMVFDSLDHELWPTFDSTDHQPLKREER